MHRGGYPRYILLLGELSGLYIIQYPEKPGSNKLAHCWSFWLYRAALNRRSPDMYIYTAHLMGTHEHPVCVRCTWYSYNGCVQGCSAIWRGLPRETVSFCDKLPACQAVCLHVSHRGCTETVSRGKGPCVKEQKPHFLFFLHFIWVKLHLMSGPGAFLFAAPPFPAAVFCTPGDFVFFFCYAIACVRGILRCYVVYNSTRYWCSQIPNCKMLLLFFKLPWGNDGILLLGHTSFCWYDKNV